MQIASSFLPPRGASLPLRSLWSALALLVFVGCLGLAQTITTGDVTGVVKDTSGAILPDAKVDIKNTATGATRNQNTTSSGSYRFTALEPGTYLINASTPGLTSNPTSAVISVGQSVTINLTLSPQASKTEVSVTDAVPLLQADNPNISTTLTGKQIENLPLPGGDTTTVAFTVPGIVVNTGSGYGNFSSHGLPGTSNLFTVNGNDNEDPYLNLNNSGSSNLTLGANEIAEEAVVQNAYSVSYGRQAGAQINEVTKSGSNQFHGNAIWDWNGDFLNANDFFNNKNNVSRPRSNSNQYAASIGGPIIKNKTFFFVDTEGIRYIIPSAGIATLPTVPFENYVLGQVGPSQRSLYQNAFNLYNSAPGANRAQNVTTGSGNLQDSTGNLGCGNLAGTAVPGGGTFGVDTPCARAFGVNVVNQNTEWLLSARVDQEINDKQKIFFRFREDHGRQPTHTDFINPIFNAQSIQPEYEGQVDHTYTISPTVVNHFIFSASWYSAIFTPASIPASLAAFPTYFNFAATGGANGSNNAFTPLGLETNFYPQGRNVAQGQFIDDLTVIKGNHTLRFGGNYRKNQVSDYGPQTLTEGGQYIFANMSDFATGAFANQALAANPIMQSTYSQAFSSLLVAHTRFYNLGVYLQDEWAIRPNVKITYGIRFDRTGNPSCLDDCFARLNGPFDPTAASATTPYNASITAGLRHEVANFEPVVYQPRVGFVWSPSSKTVVRGGIGIFSDLAPGDLVTSIYSNAPTIFTPTVLSGVVGAPGTASAIAGSAPVSAAAANAAFRQGFAAGDTLQQIQALTPASSPFTPPNFYSTPNKLYNPKYAEWSFEVQQELDSKSTVTLSYVGNHGYNLILENGLLNAANTSGLPGFGILPATPPDPRFGAMNSVQNDGVSNYDGFTATYRRGLGYGFQGEASYTWSHALDDLSGVAGTPYNNYTSFVQLFYPYGKQLNYSNSDFDIRHNVTADFTWELPYKFSNRLMKEVLGGWTMGSKFFARTGEPFSVVYNGLATQITPTTGYNNNLASTALLATAINPSALNTNCGASAVNTACFNANQFTNAGFGNLPRNSFRGPGYFDIDYTVSKHFAITESHYVAIGASFYNLLNHANFQVPNTAVNGSGGLINSTVGPPTSAYGSFSGSAVSGRVIVSNITFNF